MKNQMHDVPVTNFVKHNQGLELNLANTSKFANPSNKLPHRNVMPWFFAQLVSDDAGKTYYIRYLITDSNGMLTEWHSRNATYNESKDLSLFKTDFDPNKDILVCYRDDGEVQITGTEYGSGKVLTWKSDSTQNSGTNQDDGDVSWILQ